MIIVTGGAGFIGSNLVAGLNAAGESDILVVDNLSNADKVRNLSGLDIADYMDKQEFRKAVADDKLPSGIRAVLHQGACSDTMATDGRYVLDNNFTYSKELYHFCRRRGVAYLYASSASVYGGGDTFIESPEHESTLNAYAYSKLLFDNYLRRQGDHGIQCVGLRYFNVYGPREQHKGRMASVAWHFHGQYRENGRVRLFEGSGGYGHGEQRRDFVSVEDVVAYNLFLLENPSVSGIFNLGTGNCQSFNDVAMSVINSLRARDGQDRLALDQAIAEGIIEYIPMPAALHGKYQSYTEANLDRLRATGYDKPFLNVEQGVERYIRVLDSQ